MLTDDVALLVEAVKDLQTNTEKLNEELMKININKYKKTKIRNFNFKIHIM